MRYECVVCVGEMKSTNIRLETIGAQLTAVARVFSVMLPTHLDNLALRSRQDARCSESDVATLDATVSGRPREIHSDGMIVADHLPES